VNRNTGRLINDQQVRIFKKDGGAKIGIAPAYTGILADVPSKWRHSHAIPLGNPYGWSHPPAIEPNLPIANDTIDVRSGHPFKVTDKIIIQSLP
jgi:hypothetical protein